MMNAIILGVGLAAMAGASRTEPEPLALPTFASKVDLGYVFLNGQYLCRPYTVLQIDSRLLINNQVVSCRMPTSSSSGEQQDGLFVETMLGRNAILIADDNQPLTCVQNGSGMQAFLRAITCTEPEQRRHSNRTSA